MTEITKEIKHAIYKHMQETFAMHAAYVPDLETWVEVEKGGNVKVVSDRDMAVIDAWIAGYAHKKTDAALPSESGKATKTFEFWVNLYPDGGCSFWTNEAASKIMSGARLFARKHIVFEVEEGEGL